MKKIITTILLIIIGSITFTGVTLATTGKVNASQLNLRESASTNSKILTQLTNGAELNIISEEENWYKVTYQDYTGYVSKDYVTKNTDNSSADAQTNSTTDTTTGTAQSYANRDGVLVSDAQIYVLPLLNSTKLDIIKSGASVKVISTNGKWAYIQTDSLSGWLFLSRVTITETPISNQYISTEATNSEKDNNINNGNIETSNNTATSNTTNADSYPSKMYLNADSVYIRKGADKKSDIITSVTLNTEVTVLGVSGDWYKVKYNGDEGYIYKQFLSTTKK